MKHNCKNCKYAVHDPVWGEYKCNIFQIRVYDSEREACAQYKEKSNTKEVPQ